MKMPYRYDIEGLRALAILAVLAFHINPGKLTGGFIGVDIFFVISGFLITDHILRDMRAGTFSFGQFYLKRIRRLYPALFATLLVTSAAVYYVFLPDDIAEYGLSLISATFYVSNLFFYTKSDYFNSDLENASLLHTWSLSVEEQFYLVFPLLLFACFKYWRRYTVPILIAFAVASFVLSEWLLHFNRPASFFWSPTRFWQFMAGGFIAFAAAPNIPRKYLEAAIVIGLALLGYSVYFMSGKTPFPGIYALIPTIGAALIIYAGKVPGLFMSRLMSIPPAQFFGRISYSLYLWHWPVIAIYRYRYASEFSPISQIMLGLVSIALATLSFYLIEKPTRQMKLNAPLFYKALAVSLAALAIGLFFYKADTSAGKYDSAQTEIAKYIKYGSGNHNRIGVCFMTSQNTSSKEFNRDECLKMSDTKRNILIMGDSHAAHFYDALKTLEPKANILQATASGCKPVLKPVGEERCTGVISYMMDDFIPAHKFDVIILSARWTDEDIKAAAETAKFLKQHAKKVVVSGPIIEYPVPLPRLLIFSQKENNAELLQLSAKMKEVRKTDTALREAIKSPIMYFSALDAICPLGVCKTLANDNTPMQFDYGHLTYDGALDVVGKMRKDVNIR